MISLPEATAALTSCRCQARFEVSYRCHASQVSWPRCISTLKDDENRRLPNRDNLNADVNQHSKHLSQIWRTYVIQITFFRGF